MTEQLTRFAQRQALGKQVRKLKGEKAAMVDALAGIDEFEQKNGVNGRKAPNPFEYLDTPFGENLRTMIADGGLPMEEPPATDEDEPDIFAAAETTGIERREYNLQVPVQLPRNNLQGAGSSIVSGDGTQQLPTQQAARTAMF